MEIFHHEYLKTMWSKLRIAVLFYVRHYQEPAGLTTAEVKAAFVADSQAAASSLREYAVLAELHFGHLLCKSNLHKSVCRLPVQQLVCGHAAWYMEYWVEMMVQFCKRYTKLLTTSTPELLLVNQLLLKSALTTTAAIYDGVKSFDELIPEWGGDAQVVRGSLLDVLGAGGEGFLGSGTMVAGTRQEAEVEAVLERFYHDFPEGPGKSDTVSNQHSNFVAEDTVRYSAAHRAGVETVHSALYKRSRLRESFYVQVRYEEQTAPETYQEVLYVGKVQYFLGALADGYHQHDLAGGDPPRDVTIGLRLAVTDLFPATVKATPQGDLLEVKRFDQPRHKLYPVELSKIDHKVARCLPLQNAGRSGHKMYFVPYKHTKFDRD